MTVKPIRQKLEESKSSLKETLKVGIQASELRSLQTQAAGHGSEVTFVLSTWRMLYYSIAIVAKAQVLALD